MHAFLGDLLWIAVGQEEERCVGDSTQGALVPMLGAGREA